MRAPCSLVHTRSRLLLAGYGQRHEPAFLNKFKKLGFIDYDGQLPLKVNSSLLSVVLHD